jgi:hypothetical protein
MACLEIQPLPSDSLFPFISTCKPVRFSPSSSLLYNTFSNEPIVSAHSNSLILLIPAGAAASVGTWIAFDTIGGDDCTKCLLLNSMTSHMLSLHNKVLHCLFLKHIG